MPGRETTDTRRRRAAAAEVLTGLLRDRDRYLAIARRHARGGIDGEDVLQAACISFITSYEPRSADPRPSGYLAVAIKTAALKAASRQYRREGLDGEFDEQLLAGAERPDQLELTGGVDELRRRLRELPERQRQAVGLRLLGFSVAEATEALGVSPRAYRKAIEHANASLRASSNR